MIAWGFAAVGHHDKRLFNKIAQCIPGKMKQGVQCRPQNLIDVAWAFGSGGLQNEQILSEISQKARSTVADFSPPELADMSRAFDPVDPLHSHIADQVQKLALTQNSKPADLMLMMHGLPAKACPAYDAIMPLLFGQAAQGLDGFDKNEFEMLSQVCARHLGQADGSFAYSEVAAMCRSFSLRGASPTTSSAEFEQPGLRNEVFVPDVYTVAAGEMDFLSAAPEPPSATKMGSLSFVPELAFSTVFDSKRTDDCTASLATACTDGPPSFGTAYTDRQPSFGSASEDCLETSMGDAFRRISFTDDRVPRCRFYGQAWHESDWAGEAYSLAHETVVRFSV